MQAKHIGISYFSIKIFVYALFIYMLIISYLSQLEWKFQLARISLTYHYILST